MAGLADDSDRSRAWEAGWDRAYDPTDRRDGDDEPLAVHADVVAERGRFWVELVVLFGDGAMRHRISDYATRRAAEIAAGFMRRGAERDPRDTPGSRWKEG